MDALVGSFGADAMFMGLVYGVIGAKLGDIHRMLTLAPLACAAGVGALGRTGGGGFSRSSPAHVFVK